MPCLVGLGFHPPPGRPKTGKTLSFFVCVFVTLVNVRVSAHNFAKKALDYSNDFDAAGQGKVCSCASVFNLFRLQPNGDILNAEVQKTAKIGGFRRQRATE